jgi:hypothetical protein
MKNLIISQILVYYDLPEIFTAVDDVGTSYLCLLVSIDAQKTKYIATAISNKRLKSFINGIIDLRDIFENPEMNQWLYFDNINGTIIANEWRENSLPQEFLPEIGFIYKKQLQEEEVILKEVIEIKNAVVHLSISDSNNSSSIEINDLGDIVKLYQLILENSYKKSLSQHNIKEKKSFYTPANYKLRAFASSPGSFNIHLYSTSQIDLFGNSIIELGLEKFDEITKDFDNENDFIQSLRTVKGHTISSLKKLVTKLVDSDIKLTHQWLSPSQDKVHSTVIDKAKAEKIYAILNMSEELAEEIKPFFGYFVQVDIERGTWRIFNLEDQKEYNGEATRRNLQGLIVETMNYKLTCQEIIEEFKVTEKEKIRYILQTIEQIT